MSTVHRTFSIGFEEASSDNTPNFMMLLKSEWDKIHNKPNVFRYKIDKNLKERVVGGKYLLQLNPNRATNRRIPEIISNMNQPFSEDLFNFTKASSDELLFSIGKGVDDHNLHSFLVNVSPITRYHTLFCPFINKKLPQAVTEESLYVAIKVMFIAKDSNLKMGFNSLCGLASVNHLHYHLFVETNTLPVEKAEWKLLHKDLYYLEDYACSAFCFKIKNNSTSKEITEVYRLIKYLQDNSIAHNIFIKMRASLDAVEIYVFPRKSSYGAKQLTAFNVAVLELSGCFPVFNEDAYENLTSEDLEMEMEKWKYDGFNKLLKELPGLLYGRCFE